MMNYRDMMIKFPLINSSILAATSACSGTIDRIVGLSVSNEVTASAACDFTSAYTVVKTALFPEKAKVTEPVNSPAVNFYAGFTKVDNLGLREYLQNKAAFFANFKYESELASTLFPTEETHPVSFERIKHYFQQYGMLPSSQRVVFVDAIHAFGFRILQGRIAKVMDERLGQIPEWLKPQGTSERLLLIQMIRSLHALGNEKLALHLCQAAIKVIKAPQYAFLHPLLEKFTLLEKAMLKKLRQPTVKTESVLSKITKTKTTRSASFSVPKSDIAAKTKRLPLENAKSKQLQAQMDKSLIRVDKNRRFNQSMQASKARMHYIKKMLEVFEVIMDKKLSSETKVNEITEYIEVFPQFEVDCLALSEAMKEVKRALGVGTKTAENILEDLAAWIEEQKLMSTALSKAEKIIQQAPKHADHEEIFDREIAKISPDKIVVDKLEPGCVIKNSPYFHNSILHSRARKNRAFEAEDIDTKLQKLTELSSHQSHRLLPPMSQEAKMVLQNSELQIKDNSDLNLDEVPESIREQIHRVSTQIDFHVYDNYFSENVWYLDINSMLMPIYIEEKLKEKGNARKQLTLTPPPKPQSAVPTPAEILRGQYELVSKKANFAHKLPNVICLQNIYSDLDLHQFILENYRELATGIAQNREKYISLLLSSPPDGPRLEAMLGEFLLKPTDIHVTKNSIYLHVEPISVADYSAFQRRRLAASFSHTPKFAPSQPLIRELLPAVAIQNPKHDKHPLKKSFAQIQAECVHKFRGDLRDIYFSKDNTYGYKVETSYKALARAKEAGVQLDGDLVLNHLYRSAAFYHGKYAKYATAFYYDSDHTGAQTHITCFPLIPGVEKLSHLDEIPFEYILHLRNHGFLLEDLKPDNFVRIKQTDGSYDLIPIDGKFIFHFDPHLTTTESLQDFKTAPRFPHGTGLIHHFPTLPNISNNYEFRRVYQQHWQENIELYNRDILLKQVRMSDGCLYNI